jgi:glycogen synthase
MSLLFIAPLYAPGVSGSVAFVSAMTRRLAADGHPVTVLTTNARRASDFWLRPADAPLPTHEILDGVTVERLALRYPWPAPYAFGVLRRAGHWLARSPLPAVLQRPLLTALARWMPPLVGRRQSLSDLIAKAELVCAVESSWDGLFVEAATTAMRLRKPFVAMPLMHLGDASVQAHFQMPHQIDAYRGADAVLALSAREAIAYRRLGVAARRIHRIPMGVDVPSAGLFDPALGTAFRQARGIAHPLVAFLGANTYDKGAFTLALVAAALNQAGEAVDVAFAGPGSNDLRAFLARQPDAVRAALGGHVHLLGLVDEPTKHALLSACDLLALPSQVDTFGIVLLEAWLHGKPVIGADAGGIPELVRADETGLLVTFGDADCLGRAIRRLIADPALAGRLGAAGRARTLQEYTWDHTYRALLRVFQSV